MGNSNFNAGSIDADDIQGKLLKTVAQCVKHSTMTGVCIEQILSRLSVWQSLVSQLIANIICYSGF
jgi:hypothetical protein